MNVFLFHRDLRIVDNTALAAAQHPIAPLFIFTPDQIDQKKNKYFSHAAVQFMCESLEDLNTAIDSRLALCYGETVDVLTKIHKKTPIASLTQNRDSDISVYAAKRDAQIAAWCAKQNPSVLFNNTHQDYDLVESRELLLPTGKPYTVLAAYYKRFIKECKDKDLDLVRPVNTQSIHKDAFRQLVPPKSITLSMKDIHRFYVSNDTIAQRGGRTAALQQMANAPARLKEYDRNRNFPAIADGTTMLSAHIKFGTISIREMFAYTIKIFGKVDNPLMRELVFRSFYIKMASPIARPGLQRAESFRQDIDDNISWTQNKELWKAWTTGNTGFPLVDAGMRQLLATGHMHGRVRMVVATVLTRYFMIDWREGARFFAQHLVDYDPVSNNMGWQFGSALGENTQNVYRAPMNPFLQSKNYDPDATYIRRWVPELADVSITPKQIHTGTWPDKMYMRPVVDQKTASKSAVVAWKTAAAAVTAAAAAAITSSS